MKRHSVAEISSKVHELEALIAGGRSQAQACKELGVSVMTFHRWRKQTGDGLKEGAEAWPTTLPQADLGGGPGSEDQDSGRIDELRLENERLRRIVTDLLLEKMKIEEQVGLRTPSRGKQQNGR
jgi:putative transposase